MQLTVFEHAFLLQALGWAIANSIWQAGLLWLLYQVIINLDTKLPAVVKHHLGFILLLGSFCWFVGTLIQNYWLFASGDTTAFLFPMGESRWSIRLINNSLPFLSLIYLALLVLHFTNFTRRLVQNHYLQNSGLTKAPIDFRLFTNNTAIHLGIKRKVQVWLSAHVDVPCITGFFKPVILLPAVVLSQFSQEQVESILLHELAHIKRNDYLVNLFQSVMELVLFFNPFALLLSRMIKKERENCCDEWVITFRYNQHDYARALLLLAEQRHLNQLKLALAAVPTGKKELLTRVMRLFNTTPETNIRTVQKFKLAGIGLLLAGLLFIQFPQLMERQIGTKQAALRTIVVSASQKNMTAINETSEKSILISAPILPPEDASSPLSSSRERTKKQPARQPDEEPVNAFINEELIDPAPESETVATQVVEKSVTDEARYFVKIEEEQSGKKQQNTYVFELNIKNGTTDIKPLIILDKLNKITIKPLKSISDTLHPVKKARPKKRITS